MNINFAKFNAFGENRRQKKTRQKHGLTRVTSPNSSLSARCLSFVRIEGRLMPVLEVAALELIEWVAGAFNMVDTETNVPDDAWGG
jgi:hypothetical protein